QLRIVPKDKLAELSTHPIGTGPFMFKSWSPGDRLELVKNPDYFEKGLPKLDGVTLRIVPESAARMAALESGAVDIVWSMPYESVEKFNPPDIAKAKKLLADAGFPNGFDISMQVPQEREQRVRVGVAVRDMARAAGIRINVERVPFASYTANVAGKAQMYVDGYFARPTIDTSIYPFYHSSGSWNKQLWLYKARRVDHLLDEAR